MHKTLSLKKHLTNAMELVETMVNFQVKLLVSN